jgi:hypothetical protein
MKIILLAGYAGSGKDTAGSVFVKDGYKRYAVADMVKRYSAIRHGFSFDLTQTQAGKTTLHNNKMVRQYLIDDAALLKALNNDPAYWIKLMADLIISDGTCNVVITDWRYHAELSHLKVAFPNAQTTTIRIVRDSVVPLDDSSEHELDSVSTDYVVKNNDSVEHLTESLLACT